MVVREIINVSDSSEPEEEETMQVPDSSPMKTPDQKTGGLDPLDPLDSDLSSPIKPVTRLSSLKERFGYNSQMNRGGLSLSMSKDYSILRAKFPGIPSSTVSKMLKQRGSCEEAERALRSMNKIDFKPTLKLKRPSSVFGNMSSPSDKIRLSSLKFDSPLKDHDVVSSKVTLKNNRSIAERYGTTTKRKYGHFQFDLDALDEGKMKKKTKHRRLIRGSEMIQRVEDGEESSVSERLRRGEKKEYIELSSGNEEEAEAEEETNLMEDDFDDFDQDVESESEEDTSLNFDERVMKFLNTADIRDIVDISGVPTAIAQTLIEGRPYESYEQVENKEFIEVKSEGGGKSNRRNGYRRRPIGEKIIATTMRKLKGYEMVESLVDQCKRYGDDIKRAIIKWGVKVNNETGELEILSVNADDGEEENEEDLGDLEIVSSRLKADEKKKDDDENDESLSDNPDDEDYGSSKRKLVSRGQLNPNRSSRFGKIGYFKNKPKLMADDCKLKDYQQVGINWLTLLYKKGLSCILADEMGLGKTIQVIAFLAHLKECGSPSPHLIVVPASTLENWLREFEKFAPSLDVRPYYGSQVAREDLRMQLEDDDGYDVLVTTYSMATGGKLDQAFLRSRKFNVIVYDEGHMLKNSASNRYQKLMRLRGQFRLLLTGTPLQNNLRELISLLSFILPQVFTEKKAELEDLFDQKTSTNASKKVSIEDEKVNPLLSQQAIKRARTMMTPFVLRRKKSQVMKYLPAKHNHILYCDMTTAQRDIYDISISEVRSRIKEQRRRKGMTVEEIAKLPKLEGSNNYIMSLRKACMHPMIFRYLYTDDVLRVMARKIKKSPQYHDAYEQYIYEDMTVMSDFEINQLCHNFPRQLGEYILPIEFYMHSGKVKTLMDLVQKIVSRKEKVLVFSMFTQLLDVLEKVMSFKNFKFVRLDGSTAVDERQNIIDTFYEDETIPVFLLSTKAGGFGINLVAATNVIIYDMSFNPHDDKQAEDRAHRVGQTKEVNVYRLVCKDSIEQNILQVAYNKLELDTSMMSNGKVVEDMVIKKLDEAIPNSPDATSIQRDTTALPQKTHGLLAQTVADDDDLIKVAEKRVHDPAYSMNFPLTMPPSPVHIPVTVPDNPETPIEMHNI
ncbi:hypothetical protein FOA43_002946 [Brettanomyces nanus]|uniref:DNA helicase n=1 Tax=Eeniella nana TaxID=13502 RepID=A0A875S7A0_EENNA|nr:uncharacterized protein FOA43_002946 [Brettanomyces nanus]QPG75589.1 hypothetical protein FOA43_002946 [Brettanomyces nanus]